MLGPDISGVGVPLHLRLLLATLCIAFGALASACGGDADDHATSTSVPTAASGTQPLATATKASGSLILATTTSTQDSGLLDVLIPMFEQESGYTVKVVAVGSGQAIEQGSRGDADVLLTHSPKAEEDMVARGDGVERNWVMYNDFILVGPESDPAGIKQATNTSDAMTRIFDNGARFVSRGDDSGTNAKELALWKAAAVEPAGESWYSESGQGMGATLQIASQQQAYTLSDRGTFLAQRENLDLAILSEKDPALLNPYTVIVVNPAKHGNVNATGARSFAEFVVRADIQRVIGDFGVEKFGEPLFFPSAGVDPTKR